MVKKKTHQDFLIEFNELIDNNEWSYIPNKEFDGITECIKSEYKTEIIDIITNLEL